MNSFESSGLSKYGETWATVSRLVGWVIEYSIIYNTYYDLVHLQKTNSTRVCSVHFKEADFNTRLTEKRVLEKYAVPSMFCWSRSSRKRKSPKKREQPRARVRLFDRGVPSIYLFYLSIVPCHCYW